MNFIKKIGIKKFAFIIVILSLFITVKILLSTLPLPVVFSDGFEFDMMENGTYRIAAYTGKESYIEIPKTVRGVEVTEIRFFAFENNTYIKTVVIHDNIVEIGFGAFKGCTSLQSLTVPFIGNSQNHNTSLAYIFNDDQIVNLAEETPVPKSLKKLYITKGCTHISMGAFYTCSNLEEIHIPSTVTSIEDGMDLIIIGVNGHTPSDRETNLPFYGCSQNLKIYCAVSKKPEGWDDCWNNVSSSYKATVIWNSKEF